MPKKSNLNLNKLIPATNMKLSIKTLTKSNQGLTRLGTLELPVTLSFKISKTIKAVDEILEPYYKARDKRIKELGEEIKDEKGNLTGQYQVKKENDSIWEKENEEMLSQEVDVKVCKIKLSDLENQKIAPLALANLGWMLEE